MDRNYAHDRYTSEFVEDQKQGMAAQELYRTRHGKRERVARVAFWDASGQFALETFNCEVPLDVLEDLISEAKSTIKTR
jgi:hypothetical protein